MGGKTITRADLAEAVYRRLGLSRTESAAMVEMVLKEICDAIVARETVKLSSFGSFMVRDKGLRVGRNPKTGREDSIPQRNVIEFTSKKCKRAMKTLSRVRIIKRPLTHITDNIRANSVMIRN